ncbi:MAG: DsbE family thiol:disulfide interchange protein [Alphaproteobacteria bacterium]
MRFVALLPIVILAILGVFFVISLQNAGDDTLPSALVGKPLPTFALAPLAERPGTDEPGPGLESAEMKDGQVKLINFWASWCAPCRVEHPLLMELSESGEAVIHGINYKDQPDAARRFLRSLGDPFDRIGRDDTGRIGVDFGLYGVPETYVVDGDGRILARKVGPMTREDWDSRFKKFFAEAEPASSGDSDE